VATVGQLVFDGLSKQQVAVLESTVHEALPRLEQTEGPAGADKGSPTAS
jgi:hypothetical protein